MTGDKTKEGQATVIEAPYRQPAGSLANEKFRLRCGVASCRQRVGEIYPCRVVVRHAEKYNLQIASWRREAASCRLPTKDVRKVQDDGQVDKRTSGKGAAAQTADDKWSKARCLPVSPITLAAR